MALKPDYFIGGTQYVDWYMNVTAEKGEFVCINNATSPSGAAMDQAEAVAFKHTTAGADGGAASGVVRPLGFLMTDVVNIDLTRQHLNQYRDEVQIGSKVWILGNGSWVVTNAIRAGITPTIGQTAILAPSGQLTNVGSHGTSGAQAVGRFHSIKDENGYAKVLVDIQ
jgi:hypothetical protein